MDPCGALLLLVTTFRGMQVLYYWYTITVLLRCVWCGAYCLHISITCPFGTISSPTTDSLISPPLPRPTICCRGRWSLSSSVWGMGTSLWNPIPRCGRSATPRSSTCPRRTDTPGPTLPARKTASSRLRNVWRYVIQ